MAITNQQNVSQVQSLAGIDAGGLFRLANDGDTQACAKVASGEGGPDFVCTALTSAAAGDNATFVIPFASMLKLYTGPVVNAMLAIKVKVSINGDTAVANSSYTEVMTVLQDLTGAGTFTLVQVNVVLVAGTVATVVTGTGTTNLTIATGATVGAVAHRVRAEVYVNHIQ